MGGCDPTRSLRDEHALILRVVDALEAMLDGTPPGDRAGGARRFTDFFRLYTDALHHGKEEDLLFESLVEHGFSRSTGPVAHMLEEHRLGRALVRQMGGVADDVDADAAAWRTYEHAARSYVDMIRGHILKEDHALFDLADDAIDDAACRRLCDAYEDVCARRFEGRTLADLERLAEELIGRRT